MVKVEATRTYTELPVTGLIFDAFNGVIPEVVYISTERLHRILSEGRLIGAPEIVVEILSPGAANERRDKIRITRI